MVEGEIFQIVRNTTFTWLLNKLELCYNILNLYKELKMHTIH